ncbi:MULTISPECIES: hypothetical protein [Vibrio]|uniref:Uncharacterized protein n=2 Tax=Vibrio TaxID=662 RepID=B7VTN6_VIBA3|nr:MULTISPECIES: hypothetical protein [Vibrio]OEF45378.1 hypothetical protein A163_09610 [Vibrio tasmaniensis 1F-267]CAV26815.1 Hypothetical protein VS_II0949 [Vibrio atlanticus]
MGSGKKNIWLESDSIVTRKSPKPLRLNTLENIYVKEHDIKSKITRSFFIAVVFSLPIFLFRPLVGIGVFSIIGIVGYLLTKKYELRVGVFNNDDVGVVESGLYSSNEREELDGIVRLVMEYKTGK